MAGGTVAVEEVKVPAHVPVELVIAFDFYSAPLFSSDPFAAATHRAETAPRIYYSPTHYLLPGCWVVNRAEDVRHVLQHPELFSSRGGVSFSTLIEENWDLIPLELDPPTHSMFRSMLNPKFSPKEIDKLDPGIHEAARRLIAAIKHKEEFDFIKMFAHPFPVTVFLQLVGLPVEEMPTFLKWNKGLIRSFDLEERVSAIRSIVTYPRQTIEKRRKNPGSDLFSHAIHAEVDGRKITDNEIIGICFLLFVGGLDTVASSLGFHFWYLAMHPELQAKLRADRGLIPTAVEEFLRLYSVVSAHRRVTQDTEINGVLMKKGDWITVPTMNADRDPNEFPNPNGFDLDRSSNRHVAFAFGPHRCIGSHLARRELVAALNEWFDNLPPFALKPGTSVSTNGGAVFGVNELNLVWDHSAT